MGGADADASMKNWLVYGLLFVGVFALAACEASDMQLTVKAGHEIASTDMAGLRSTATVARARMQTTQDFVLTRVAEVGTAERSLRSTLGALGTVGPLVENLSSDEAAFTPLPGPLIGATDAPAARGNEARLDDIALASGKDRQGCAIDRNPRFTSDSAEIYVIARAYNIPVDAVISSSWRRLGREVASISFRTSYPIHGDCLWLFIDQSDAAFAPGRWSVELRLDGQVLGMLPFQIFAD